MTINIGFICNDKALTAHQVEQVKALCIEALQKDHATFIVSGESAGDKQLIDMFKAAGIRPAVLCEESNAKYPHQLQEIVERSSTVVALPKRSRDIHSAGHFVWSNLRKAERKGKAVKIIYAHPEGE